MYGDILRERTPMGKARLELLVTDLVMPGMALRASATAAHEWDRNAIPDFPSGHVFPDRFNYSG